jgi:hypothetical protein
VQAFAPLPYRNTQFGHSNKVQMNHPRYCHRISFISLAGRDCFASTLAHLPVPFVCHHDTWLQPKHVQARLLVPPQVCCELGRTPTHPVSSGCDFHGARSLVSSPAVPPPHGNGHSVSHAKLLKKKPSLWQAFSCCYCLEPLPHQHDLTPEVP